MHNQFNRVKILGHINLPCALYPSICEIHSFANKYMPTDVILGIFNMKYVSACDKYIQLFSPQYMTSLLLLLNICKT